MRNTQHPMSRLLSHLKQHRITVLLASICSILNKIWDLAPPLLIGIAIDVVALREKSFLAEWVRVSLAFAAISLIYHLLLSLSLVTTTELRISLIQTIFNICIYPFIVLVSHHIFRVKRPYFTRSGRVI